jgi:hypothetical protein
MPNAQVLSIDDYRRRIADEADLESRAEYDALRECEMRKIARECERERGSNIVNLRGVDWSPALPVEPLVTATIVSVTIAAAFILCLWIAT